MITTIKTYKVLIADDEAPARKKMERLVGEIENLEIIKIAANGIEALESIQELEPDIIFLDIQMPGLTGLEVAQNIDLNKSPYLVFTTAYNEHAIKAFELNAIDYLLKPINKERLEEAIDKIMKSPRGKFITKKLDETINTLKEEGFSFGKKLAISTSDRYKLLDFNEVVMVAVEERCVFVQTDERSFLSNHTLDHFAKKLDTDNFLKVNRSAIINLDNIQEIVTWSGNRFKLIMNNGKEVISSREKTKHLKKILKK